MNAPLHADLTEAQLTMCLATHCPFCDSDVDVICRRPDGRPYQRGVHEARVKRAARIVIDGMTPPPQDRGPARRLPLRCAVERARRQARHLEGHDRMPAPLFEQRGDAAEEMTT